MKSLVLGFGNVDREDDGVAWHVLNRLATRLGGTAADLGEMEDSFVSIGGVDFLFVLQLTPELGETIAAYDRVCFVDAHTGDVAEELQFIEIPTEFQKSPLTHHMTPQTCLAIARDLYGHQPKGYLLSVRGYEFGFAQALSARTEQLANQAVDLLARWAAEDDLYIHFGDNTPTRQ
ncbi:MAG TPA: hydrogenase maturation protease [Anaerolineaceae bacterium]|nr:hydrogenase maturation protease [Anaerolineaceae bacterium]